MNRDGDKVRHAAACPKSASGRVSRVHSEYVQKLLEGWPPLTEEQRAALALVIRDRPDP
jgi:hypothetical protein